jgi:hypothetical protein
MVGNKVAALAMSAAATCPLMDLLLHEALRLARIMHPTIAPLKIALPKAALQTRVPRRGARKKAIPKRRVLKTIIVHTAISRIIRRCRTFTTMTRGSATILAVTMPIIMSIILGNTAASLAALDGVTSIALAAETATASGSTIFISASRRMTMITSIIGIGIAIPS